MAVDRLAARRAAQQNSGYNPTQASGNGAYQGYQSRRPNPYAQQDDQPYEMSDVRTPAAPTDAFSEEILSIEKRINEYNDNVNRIGSLQLQSVNAMGGQAAAVDTGELELLVQKTSELSSSLKRQIQNLDGQVGSGRDAQIRQQQTTFVKRKFVKAIQDYQNVEQQYREGQKNRLTRQYKIVKPDATTEEINAALANPNPGQIFSQALLYGDSHAYQEVQARHQDIKRIEQTIAELAQLFNDMSVLVSQQQETIEVIETQAAAVEHDTEAGLKHTNDAVKSARAARKKRWICFFIIVLIIVIIAATIGGYFASQNKKSTSA